MRKIILVAFLAVFTAACTNSYRSDVTRFHQLPEPRGETVFITSSDPAKAGSLELAQYAGLLVPRLQSLGYNVVSDPKADLVVEIDYDVTQSERRYYRYGGYSFYHHYPYFSPYHIGFRHHGFGHHGFGHYGFGYSYYPQEPYYRTVYTNRLVMKIRRANGELLFEGSALSTNYQDRLPKVMPYLVGAMFTNFPGQSGETEVVRMDRADYGQS